MSRSCFSCGSRVFRQMIRIVGNVELSVIKSRSCFHVEALLRVLSCHCDIKCRFRGEFDILSSAHQRNCCTVIMIRCCFSEGSSIPTKKCQMLSYQCEGLMDLKIWDIHPPPLPGRPSPLFLSHITAPKPQSQANRRFVLHSALA